MDIQIFADDLDIDSISKKIDSINILHKNVNQNDDFD